MRTAAARPRRVTNSRQRWVRKNMVVDQRKLDVARRALHAHTAAELDAFFRRALVVTFLSAAAGLNRTM